VINKTALSMTLLVNLRKKRTEDYAHDNHHHLILLAPRRGEIRPDESAAPECAVGDAKPSAA
jgi:hypothetical protein